MRKLQVRRHSLRQIRSYRRPLPNPYAGLPITHSTRPEFNYEDVFIVSENPLLELTHADLCFLRERGIDPFADDGR